MPATAVCDGVWSCWGGEDEDGCGLICQTYEVANCDGSCTLASWLGDNDCDAALDCEATGWDDGDCVCGADDFVCAGGDCVPPSAVCDGGWDCPAGDDEAGCGVICQDWQVESCDGSCTSASWLGDGTCDSALDCEATNWDHGDCTCAPGEFECDDSQCVPATAVCDGVWSCWSGEDEDGCGVICQSYEVENCDGSCTQASWLGDNDCDAALDCEATGWDDGDCVCGVDDFVCAGGDCVPPSAVCDGGWDCPAGDDEAGCGVICQDWQVENCDGSCSSASWLGDGACDSALDCEAMGWDDGDCLCAADEYECDSGQCVPATAVCDGFWTCWDGDDEDGCGLICQSYEVENCDGSCTQASWLGDNDCDAALDCEATGWDDGDCVCGVNDFVCAGGDCVAPSAVCDGGWDCPAGDDEIGCGVICESWQVENCDGWCSSASWLGDGTCNSSLDCEATGWDGGDCLCAADEFECDSGQCVPATAVCDGVWSCWSGEDEDGCGLICQSNQVPDCNGTCTFASWLGDNDCDPVLDCEATGWDDGDCVCGAHDFECSDGECVPESAVCDGGWDCWDGGDESACP